jgi:hypothetical protein
MNPVTLVLNKRTSTTLLVLLLRLGGVITGSAFLAVFLPVEWMESIHEWLGLGEFPRAPVVDYLARSVACLYGFHGALLLLVSGDPVRYRSLVWFIAFMNAAFGLLLIGIDVHAGMPAFWTLAEGPPIIMLGAAIAFLNHRSRGPQ